MESLDGRRPGWITHDALIPGKPGRLRRDPCFVLGLTSHLELILHRKVSGSQDIFEKDLAEAG